MEYFVIRLSSLIWLRRVQNEDGSTHEVLTEFLDVSVDILLTDAEIFSQIFDVASESLKVGIVFEYLGDH